MSSHLVVHEAPRDALGRVTVFYLVMQFLTLREIGDLARTSREILAASREPGNDQEALFRFFNHYEGQPMIRRLDDTIRFRLSSRFLNIEALEREYNVKRAQDVYFYYQFASQEAFETALRALWANRRLERLTVNSGARMQNADVQYLASALPPRLQALQINATICTNLYLFASVPDLQVLSLTFCRIDDVQTSMIADALKTNGHLRTMHLDYNEIGDAGAHAMIAMISTNRVLERLSLQGNQIDVGILIQIGDMMERRPRRVMRNLRLEF